MSTHFHFPMYRQLLVALLCLGMAASSFAQVRPVTGISAHYDDLSDTSDDYSTPGSGGGGIPAEPSTI